MGIPKFFKWIVHRYPLVYKEIKSDDILPPVDRFYVDVNGLIHQSAASEKAQLLDENFIRKVILLTFVKIDHLFSLVKPKKLLYLSLDGVAPRAKIFNQRKRRFYHAKCRNESLEGLKQDNYFDSNCITPGTEFMYRVNQSIRAYIETKILTDASWRSIEVIYSGSDVPGEGEHKIMNYIRELKSSVNYDIKTTHCIYSPDADIVLLALITHEPYFTIIRDPVFKLFSDVNEPTYLLAHVSLLREYIFLEFEVLSTPGLLTFPYDVECVIDDLILLVCFVGNDFLPCLPGNYIKTGAIDRIFATYKETLKKLGGYLTDRGFINYDKLALFFKHYAVTEFQHLRSHVKKVSKNGTSHNSFLRAMSLAQDSHRRSSSNSKTNVAVPGFNVLHDSPTSVGRLNSALSAYSLANLAEYVEDDEDDVDDGSVKIEDHDDFHMVEKVETDDEVDVLEVFQKEDDEIDNLQTLDNSKTVDDNCDFQILEDSKSLSSVESDKNEDDLKLESDVFDNASSADEEEYNVSVKYWSDSSRIEYYHIKLGISLQEGNNVELDALLQDYMKGLSWVMHYYFHGCVSWSWCYKHHYAPLIRDLVGAKLKNTQFEMSKPYCPFEQLLSVMPPSSSSMLPKALRHVLTSENSPLAEYCSMDFEIDMEDKNEEWSGVMLISYIPDGMVQQEYAKVPKSEFTQEEILWNMQSYEHVYNYVEATGLVSISRYSKPQIIDDYLMRFGKINVISSFVLLSDAYPCDLKPASIPSLFSKPLQPALQVNSTFVIGRSSCISLVLYLQPFGEVDYVRNLSKSRFVNFKSSNFPKCASEEIALVKKKFSYESNCFEWPYYREAIITGICVECGIYTGTDWSQLLDWKTATGWLEWTSVVSRCFENYKKLAVCLGPIYCLLRVRFLIGMCRRSDGSTCKQWAGKDFYIPVQTVLTFQSSVDTRHIERPFVPLPIKSMINKPAVCINRSQYYGQLLVVRQVSRHYVIAECKYCKPLHFSHSIITKSCSGWISERDLAIKFSVTCRAINHICSRLVVDPYQFNIGLGFRNSISYAADYVFVIKRVLDDGRCFRSNYYSPKATKIVKEYLEQFPHVLAYLKKYTLNTQKNCLFEGLDDEQIKLTIKEMQKWKSDLLISESFLVESNVFTFGVDVVSHIAEKMALNRLNYESSNSVQLKLHVSDLMFPLSSFETNYDEYFDALGNMVYLGASVIYVKDSGSVEFGKTGVIILLRENSAHVLLDEPSFMATDLGGHCAMNMGVNLPLSSIVVRGSYYNIPSVINSKTFTKTAKSPAFKKLDSTKRLPKPQSRHRILARPNADSTVCDAAEVTNNSCVDESSRQILSMRNKFSGYRVKNHNEIPTLSTSRERDNQS